MPWGSRHVDQVFYVSMPSNRHGCTHFQAPLCKLLIILVNTVSGWDTAGVLWLMRPRGFALEPCQLPVTPSSRNWPTAVEPNVGAHLCIMREWISAFTRSTLRPEIWLLTWCEGLSWKGWRILGLRSTDDDSEHHMCFVCMRVFCNSFCSVCFCVNLCSLSMCIFSHVSLVYSLLIQLYGFVSFYTQLLLILFTYFAFQ